MPSIRIYQYSIRLIFFLHRERCCSFGRIKHSYSVLYAECWLVAYIEYKRCSITKAFKVFAVVQHATLYADRYQCDIFDVGVIRTQSNCQHVFFSSGKRIIQRIVVVLPQKSRCFSYVKLFYLACFKGLNQKCM